MRTDTEGLRHILTTLRVRTLLRGVVRCYSDQLSTSTFSLVQEHGSQCPPGCITNSKGQTMVANHVGRFQVFHHDRLVAIDRVSTRFMEGILALVMDTLMKTSHLLLDFLASVAPLLAPCKLFLSFGKFLGARLRVLGVFDDVSIAIGHEGADTHIQAESIVLLGEWFRFGLANT